ncbi:unnamed protein product [Rodentolepis nana]|uniref:Uncharacterized protein n=1 Tax=Rodentolepis nana TaxID=102285 RepID=A0A0R3TER7_RODNA|nr:unnamed protein product [Rodentolepis nana]
MECDSTCREDPFHYRGYGEDGASIAINLKTIAVDVKIPEPSYPYYEERVNVESVIDKITNPLAVTDEVYFPISRLSPSQRAIRPSTHKYQNGNTTDQRPSITRTAHLVAAFHRENLRKHRRIRRSHLTTPSSNENRSEVDDENVNQNANRCVYRTYVQKRVLTDKNGATPKLEIAAYRQTDDLSFQLNRMSLFDSKENAISTVNSDENITEMEV